LFGRVIQTFGDSTYGHHALSRPSHRPGDFLSADHDVDTDGLFQVAAHEMDHLGRHPRHADLDPHRITVTTIIERIRRQVTSGKWL